MQKHSSRDGDRARARRSGAARWRSIALWVVFGWFLLGGIAHFVFTKTEIRIVPPYIAWPHAAVIISGVFELLGAAGLIWPTTRRAAAAGLFVLTLAVTPAHIYMLQQPQRFEIPYWLLILRLPLQAALLVLIAWCASGPADRRDAL